MFTKYFLKDFSDYSNKSIYPEDIVIIGD